MTGGARPSICEERVHGFTDWDLELCQHTDGPCPDHFCRLSSRALQESHQDPMRFLDTVNHLIRHEWVSVAVLTWVALIARYGLPDPAEEPQPDDALGVHWGNERPRWAPLFEGLIRAAAHRDGANVTAVLRTILTGDDDEASAEMLATIAHTAYLVVRQHPEATRGTVLLYHVLGLRVTCDEAFGVLDLLAGLVMACATGDVPTVETLLPRLGERSEKEQLAALCVAGMAAGDMLPEGEPPPLLATERTPDGWRPTGILDWRDESLDAGRTSQDIAACWAMRTARALRAGDTGWVEKTVERAPDVGRWVHTTTFGLTNLLAGSGAFVRPPVT